MTRFALVAAFGVFLLVVGSPAGAAEPVRCTGAVLDSNGSAVAGAEVTLLQWKDDEVTSEIDVQVIGKAAADASGAFAIDARIDPQADAIVAAHKKGLAWHWAWLRRPRKPAPVALRLGPAAALAGAVVDAAGKPIAGADVWCEPHVQAPTHIIYIPRAAPLEWLRARTDKDGRWRIEGLPLRSRSLLEVHAPGKATTTTADEGYLDWWASCPHAAGDANISIVLPEEAAVEGKVVEKTSGKAVAGAKVFVFEWQVTSPLAVLTDEGGKFRIGGLSEGPHEVELVQAIDRPADWVPASREFVAQAGKTARADLEVSKGGVLEVEVTEEDGDKPVAGAEVTADSDEPSFPSVTALTDRLGVARLRLWACAWSVSAWKQGEYETEEAEDSAEVKDGKTAHVEIAMSQRAGRARAVVRDPNGRPVPGAVVCGGGCGFMDRGQTDAAGEFGLDDLPGEGQGIVVRVEERNLAGVTLLEDANEVVEIRLEPARTVRGRVVDERGKAVPIAAVTISGTALPGGQDDEEGGVGVYDSDTAVGQDGRFEIRAIPRGRYMLTARAHGYGEVELPLDVPADANATVAADDLVLPLADRTVSGVVVDAAGKPVPYAEVSVSGERQPERDSITADGAGKFTLRRLVKGTVTVEADKDDRSGSVDVEAGATGVKVVLRADDSPPMLTGEDF